TEDEQAVAPEPTAVIEAAQTAFAVEKGKDVTIPFVVEGGKVASVTSSDETIAKIVTQKDGSVKVKGLKPGKATITVTTEDGAVKTFTITVAKKSVGVDKVVISDGSKLKTSYTVLKGQTATVKTTLKGTVKWSSSKSSVASVDKDGKVTAKKMGTVKITAKSGSKTQTFKVKVVKKLPKSTPAAKVTIKNPPKIIKAGESKTLDVRMTSTIPTNTVVKFKSDKTGVIIVDAAGKLTAKKPGKANITVTAGGKSVTFSVSVK
ncbi:MAG: Ig-like domain-containing protein, partial [Clostridiales Family XIII bacterium]|nr:Ig-like domain-containing protein [Clostridiales Family XIII bacterium]